MTATREHLAGLELAKKAMEQQRARYGGVHKASLACLDGLIDLAQSAPEPVQGEANPVLRYADSYRRMARAGVEEVGIWSVITDLERNIAPLYTAAAKPDAELVALLRGLVEIVGRKNRGRPGSPNHSHTIPGIWDSDNGDLAGKPCAECALYDLAVARIAALQP